MLLTSGYVGSALGDRCMIAFRLRFNKVIGLGNLCCQLYILLGNLRLAVTDVGINGSGEQDTLLRNIANAVAKVMLGHVTDVYAIHLHAALCYIIKSWER